MDEFIQEDDMDVLFDAALTLKYTTSEGEVIKLNSEQWVALVTFLVENDEGLRDELRKGAPTREEVKACLENYDAKKH